jgi:hypothetical protein
MAQLRPLLPARYAPLNERGHGSQSIYLTELPEPLAFALADLVSVELAALARGEAVSQPASVARVPEQMRWEDHLRETIERDATIAETVREALVLARRGQGLFRARVQAIETHCRVTRVDRPEHLRASHCKPWRDSSNEERLVNVGSFRASQAPFLEFHRDAVFLRARVRS